MKQALLGLAVMTLSAGSTLLASQNTLASSPSLSQPAENFQTVTASNSNIPIFVSVSPNWASKLPSARNKAFALVPSENTVPTTASMSSSTLKKSLLPSPILVSVGPDWMRKLPRVKDTISRELAEFIKSNYAQGNRKDAWVEALEVRGTRLYMRAKVRHYHVWSSPIGRKTMYNVTNTIETSFDPLNPNQTLDGSRMCFDLARQIGGGRVCVSARDVVRIIVAGL